MNTTAPYNTWIDICHEIFMDRYREHWRREQGARSLSEADVHGAAKRADKLRQARQACLVLSGNA